MFKLFNCLALLLILFCHNNQSYALRLTEQQLLQWYDPTSLNSQVLNLDGRDIDSIEPGTFARFSLTNRVILDENKLTTLENETFIGLTNLLSLELHQNQITKIEQLAFSGLENLKILYLDGNHLNKLENGVLKPLINLDTLSMPACIYLTTIESNALNGLSRLTAVQFSSSKIGRIEQGTFAGLTNLQTLDISRNQLSFIAARAFGDLINLQQLDLTFNQQFNIDRKMFSGLRIEIGIEMKQLKESSLFCANYDRNTIVVDRLQNVSFCDAENDKLICRNIDQICTVSSSQKNILKKLLIRK